MLRLASNLLRNGRNSSFKNINTSPKPINPDYKNDFKNDFKNEFKKVLETSPVTIQPSDYHHITQSQHKLDVNPYSKLILNYGIHDIKHFESSNKWAVTVQYKDSKTFAYHIYKGPTIDFKFDSHGVFLGFGPMEPVTSKSKPAIFKIKQLTSELKKPENSGFLNWKLSSFGVIHRKPTCNFETSLLPEHEKFAHVSRMDLDEFGFKSKPSARLFDSSGRTKRKLLSYRLFENRKMLLLNPEVNVHTPEFVTNDVGRVLDLELRSYLKHTSNRIINQTESTIEHPIFNCYKLGDLKVILTPKHCKLNDSERKNLLRCYQNENTIYVNNYVTDLAFVSIIPPDKNPLIIDSEKQNLENLFITDNRKLVNRKEKGKNKFLLDKQQLNYAKLLKDKTTDHEKYIARRSYRLYGRFHPVDFFSIRTVRNPPMLALVRHYWFSGYSRTCWLRGGKKQSSTSRFKQASFVALEVTRAKPKFDKNRSLMEKISKIPFAFYSNNRLYDVNKLVDLRQSTEVYSKISFKTKRLKKYLRRFEKCIPAMISRNGTMSHKNMKRTIHPLKEDSDLLGATHQPKNLKTDYKLENFQTPSMPRPKINYQHKTAIDYQYSDDIFILKLSSSQFKMLREELRRTLYVYGEMPNSERMNLDYMMSLDEHRTFHYRTIKKYFYMEEDMWCSTYIEKRCLVGSRGRRKVDVDSECGLIETFEDDNEIENYLGDDKVLKKKARKLGTKKRVPTSKE